jgi:hypothetical protein
MGLLTDAQELNAICLLIVSICTSFMTKKTINVEIETKKLYSKPFRQRLLYKTSQLPLQCSLII